MDNAPFIFASYEFDARHCLLRMTYRYEEGPEFVETIQFPQETHALSKDEQHALDATLRLLFLLSGVSYYKAYLPTNLHCEAFDLDAPTAAFIEKVYRHGLGEFSYKNQIDISSRIKIAAKVAAAPQPVSLSLKHHLCVPVGGGKDSIVTFEYLKRLKIPITLFALGTKSGMAAPIAATLAASGLPSLNVERQLSPSLFELNAKGALNGHVPITAILSVIALATSILQGFDTVVMSNEHSASAPNLIFNDLEINHQYSKSLTFEEDLSRYIAMHISPDLKYFSFLRPLSETAIVARFAKLPAYHSIFRSCNTAFRQDLASRGTHWCGDCPKCRFIFLSMAPFVERAKLITIFGKNMLDDKMQEEGFAELCGLSAHKPFECVGEIEESALLMEELYQSNVWKDDCVVRTIGARTAALAPDFDRSFDELFVVNSDHHVPPEYLKLLYDAT